MTAEEFGNLPKDVLDIIYSLDEDQELYTECNRIRIELERIGWTCEYGLDGTITDIRKKS